MSLSNIQCPSCGEYEMMYVEACGQSFRVCGNCDYGINEHTEEVCDCARR